MNGIQITTDQWVLWQSDAWPFVKLNATIAFSWVIMAILVIGSWATTRRLSTALSAIAQQPDSSNTITRTLFVGLAMIESTAIYCFVVSMILLFANPFWNHLTQ